MSNAEQYFDQHEEQIFQNLHALLSFPSISTDPAYRKDCEECLSWLKTYVEGLGFKAEELVTIGKPVLFAERSVDPKLPTLIFYGHYDVQPVDPLEAWTSEPFKPEIRDGRLYARGAQDNKGQLFYVLSALKYLIETDNIPWNVKLLFEGEEECGSVGLSDILPRIKDKLSADLLLVCDTGTRAPEICTITMGLRGILGLTVTLSGPRTDLHSGVHGGVAPNPAQELVKLLSQLHNSDGSIAIDGYYDGIQDATAKELELAARTPITAEFYKMLSGVPPLGGEQGLDFAVRRGFRPTLEFNGISSGYAGPGMKTIIPAKASAKISSRIVMGQDPERCLKLLQDKIRSLAPEGLTLEIADPEVGGPALRVDVNSKFLSKAQAALDPLTDQPTEFSWEGASIPILSILAQTSGAEPLLVGFGLESDNIHAPNESFMIEQFKKGFLFAASFLSTR